MRKALAAGAFTMLGLTLGLGGTGAQASVRSAHEFKCTYTYNGTTYTFVVYGDRAEDYATAHGATCTPSE